MVHPLQDKGVEIAEITRHEIPDDLPFAVRQQLVAICEAFEHEMHELGRIALVDDLGAGGQAASSTDDGVEKIAIRLRQRVSTKEFCDDW